jgi:hypothetical protein
VSFAGAVAQRRYAQRSDWRGGMGHTGVSPKAAKWLARAHSGTDLANINNHLQHLIVGPPDYDYEDHEWCYLPHQVLDHKALKPYHAKFEARAAALVKQLWPQIERVAEALLEHKSLTEAEVYKLMGVRRVRPREDDSFYNEDNGDFYG